MSSFVLAIRALRCPFAVVYVPVGCDHVNPEDGCNVEVGVVHQ